MQKAAVLTVALLLVASLDARATENVTCDQASLAKLETDIGAMSGKGKKRAMKQLSVAKKAFEAGDMKKCERIVARIAAGSQARASIDATNAQFQLLGQCHPSHSPPIASWRDRWTFTWKMPPMMLD